MHQSPAATRTEFTVPLMLMGYKLYSTDLQAEFQPGVHTCREGYWTGNKFMKQVQSAVEIAEFKCAQATGLHSFGYLISAGVTLLLLMTPSMRTGFLLVCNNLHSRTVRSFLAINLPIDSAAPCRHLQSIYGIG